MILKKLYTCFFCLLFFSINFPICLAQDCFPEDLTIYSQQQVDDFLVQHPNCTKIEGTLSISGTNVSNLNGFKNIKSLGGLFVSSNYELINFKGLSSLDTIHNYLTIYTNQFLSSLDGLESLQHISGGLFIESNDSLQNLESLSRIKAIGGDLTIRNNDNLKDLKGLSSLESLGGGLIIGLNDNLNSLVGLESLQFINTNLWIFFNNNLISLDGLSGLNKIQGGLFIQINENLKSLDALKSLKHIFTDLDISNNSKLTSINSFEALEFVGGNITINFNPKLNDLSSFGCLNFFGTESFSIVANNSLKSLEGISHLELKNISRIIITNNNMLTNCAVESICDYLSNGQELILSDNGENCNTNIRIKNACKNTQKTTITCEGVPFPNPTMDHLMLSCDCDHLNTIKFKIFNVSGRLLSSGLFSNQPINVSQLPPGTYFIKFEDSNEIDLSFSFIKM